MLPGEDRAARRVLMVSMAAGVTTLLDQSVLNIAVPALRQSLEAGPTDVQWIVAGYSLAFGLMLVPGGSLGDVHGRKGLFLVGLSAFVLFGVVAASGARADVVIAARLVQGAGAGLVNSQVIGTLQDHFTGLDRARALGLYAVTGGVAAALGPALGGALVAACGPEYGWRLCLLLSTPCGMLTLWLAFRWFPDARRTAGHSELDWWGLVSVGVFALALMLPFIRTPGDPLEAALWIGAAVSSVCCLVAGHRSRIRSGRVPLVHPSLPRSRPYTLGTAIAMASFGSSLAATLVLTVFLQSGLGRSALTAALVTLPSAAAMGVTSAVAWRVVRRLGPHTVTLGLALGALTLLGGAAVALTAPRPRLLPALAAVQLLSGAAAGLTVSPNQALVLQHAPAEAAGVAGGILQMAQRIAAAVALSAVSGSYLHGTSGPSGDPRTAFAHATLLCAGLLMAATVLSLLRPRLTAGRHRPPARVQEHPRAAPAREEA
ncbi:MFS transporter [Streptomyces phaeofaciens]|uniref:MFS transporter n=1 Tax=Streptomyces phaeofaciens TaxID=68254 RepID=UPI0036BFD270